MLYSMLAKSSKAKSTPYALIQYVRLHKSHYEVLNVSNDCSGQQIKEAFIKLSKEHHPDVNKSKQSHAKFLQINEAYKILGKQETRRLYDLGLRIPADQYANTTSTQNAFRDQTFWSNRDKREDEFYKNKAYYGIKGIKRMSNGAIAVVCVILSLVGLGLQYVAVTKSFTFKRHEIIRRSIEAEKVLNEVRIGASNGNDVQIEALETRLRAIK